jgi:hypothetical protein
MQAMETFTTPSGLYGASGAALRRLTQSVRDQPAFRRLASKMLSGVCRQETLTMQLAFNKFSTKTVFGIR